MGFFDYDSLNKELRDVKEEHRVLKPPTLIDEFIQNHIYQRWDGIQKIKIPSKENLVQKEIACSSRCFTSSICWFHRSRTF